MSLKIFGGVAKGFELLSPRDRNTRPTAVQLRRKLFDSIQIMQDKIFIDLCAGTGAMGLEALSRGISGLRLIDKNTKLAQANYHLLKSNFEILVPVEIIKTDAIKWLEEQRSEWDTERAILFFDPPYHMVNLYREFFEITSGSNEAIRVIEACEQKTMKIKQFEKEFGAATKTFKQGTSYFLIYENNVG